MSTLIMKPAQFNYVDVWNSNIPGWCAHTRVQIRKIDGVKKAFYVSGQPLPKIRLVEIAKSL